MISYEAAPGAQVYIKGSEVVKDGWTQDPAVAFGRPSATPPPPQAPTWGFRLTGAMFPDAYNPFALASVAGDRVWLNTKAVDMGHTSAAVVWCLRTASHWSRWSCSVSW